MFTQFLGVKSYKEHFQGSENIVALLALVNKTGSESKPEYLIIDDPDCSYISWHDSGLYSLSFLGKVCVGF